MARPPTIEDDATSVLNWYRTYIAHMDRDKYPRQRDVEAWLRMTDRFSPLRVELIEQEIRLRLAAKAAATRRRKKDRAQKDAVAKAQLSFL